ncbi:MAG: Na+/H+ antiporter [Acidimicrobiaceae bacterium]|nr:Na+/H+ antiporter [Acidimicrobiaceae bacterium]
MHSQLLIVLVAAAVVWAGTAWLRRRAIPTPVVLVVAGVVLGFLPFVPDTSLEPEVVLLGFLPLLIFHAAFTSSPREFLSHGTPIFLLATGLVVITAAAVAVVAHFLGDLSWPMAFVLGTAVGPTDASAAISIVRRLGLSRQLVIVLEGEALFNDATALVLYAAAVADAVSGHVSVGHTIATVIYSAVVGAAVGLAVALAGHPVRRLIDDPPMEIALSILLAYAAYLPAEAAGASGVLAAVTAGLYLGWHSPGALSARTRLQSAVFWDLLIFLIEGALFILVGLSLHTFTAGARGPIGRLVVTGVIVVSAVIVLRLVWLFAMSRVLRLLRGMRTPSRRTDQIVLGWSGMRGAVTLAAVLAVPLVTDDGAPLAGRDDVIYLAFAVILATLIGQGLTLPVLARRFRPVDEGAEETEREVRLDLVRAAVRRLDEEIRSGDLPEEVTAALTAQFRARTRALRGHGEDPEMHELSVAKERALRRELLAVQRRRLLELRRERRLSVETVRDIERDLDLDETRLR